MSGSRAKAAILANPGERGVKSAAEKGSEISDFALGAEERRPDQRLLPF
jgi:hypothetical protein